MVNGASDFSGGGFFVGYWVSSLWIFTLPSVFSYIFSHILLKHHALTILLTLQQLHTMQLTTGSPDNRESSSLSNGIFVGGWYTSAIKLSMTYGTSGVHVCPNPSAVQSPEVASESPSLSPTGSPVVADSEAPSKIPTGSPALLVDPQGVDSTESPTTPVITTTTSPVASLVETPENSICQLTTVTVTESIKVTTVAIKLNYTGCVTVTVEHKIDDSPWTMMCTAHNVYGQAPEDTLANSDHCTPLVLSAGQTVDFRTKTQPSNDCGPGSGGNIVPFSSFYLQVAYSTTENVCPI